jgi:hypothetical protein
MDWIWGFAMGVCGAVAAMVGWINPKFKKLEEKIELNVKSIEDDIAETSDTLHARISTVDKLVVSLEGSHKATMMMHHSLSDSLKDLNKKTDDQTKILHEVVGELKAIKRNRDDL